MSKPEVWRLVFRNNNQLYKICNFWGWDKDATLNIKIYSNTSQGYKVEGISQTETKNPDGTTRVSQTISYDKVTPINFIPNKHTFHPSGFIHTTNNKGERYESGIKSIPFEKIENFHLLTLIFPKDPITYPQISEKDLGKNDVVLNTAVFQDSPFLINVYVVRGKNEPPTNPKASVFADMVCGDDEMYNLFVRCEQTPETVGKPFPPYTFIGTPIHKDK